MIFDNFLSPSTYAAIREYADNAFYKDYTSPVDGVIYPGVCVVIPSFIKFEILANLHCWGGSKPKNVMMFMRLSLAGVKAPHSAHHDGVMGKFSLMLYLNRAEHCNGGTELLTHTETGYCESDKDNDALLYEQSNNKEAWHCNFIAKMDTNRAFLFNANRFHRATESFGDSPENGRLLLTAFFS